MMRKREALTAVLLTGMIGCFIVAIVAIINDRPMIAKFSGSGGVVIAVGTKVATGGRS